MELFTLVWQGSKSASSLVEFNSCGFFASKDFILYFLLSLIPFSSAVRRSSFNFPISLYFFCACLYSFYFLSKKLTVIGIIIISEQNKTQSKIQKNQSELCLKYSWGLLIIII